MISSNRVKINDHWRYRKNSQEAAVAVQLPHTNQEVPLQYFDEKMYQFVSSYEKELPDCQHGKRIFLQFDGIMTAFDLSVNGVSAGFYKGGYLPHAVEITPFLAEKGPNRIRVEVDSTERPDIPPFGYAIDYLTFGGIYRDAWLFSLDRCFLRNCFFQYEVVRHDGKNGDILCRPVIEIDNGGGRTAARAELCVAGKSVSFSLELEEGVHQYRPEPFTLEQVALWSLENPVLYPVKFRVSGEGFADCAEISVGFRKMELCADGAKLNGKSISLFGLNRHQSYPYVGYAMPKRAQERDAQILKQELGLNLVRTSHYPQSPYFLDECDRLGLLVLEEIPGWQYISKEKAWRDQVLCDVRGMIERDYNHPSVITWGVRINESQDDDALYSQTTNLARSLDGTRPVCGVRCIENSHFLEDIYTINDFIHDGSSNILRTRERCTGLEKPVPYLVTEFCGHIYPTKRFDQEERLIEHALRHGRVQSLAAQKEEYLGAIGWCAFDYGTHFDFGSGDRICYHGVMDMFRVPKFAAAVYKSQRSRKEGYVLEPLTYWARGERDKGSLSPIYVFTNCRKIEVKLGGITRQTLRRAFFNTDRQMQYLKNPPFVVEINNGEWGEHLTELEIIGYDEEKPVCQKRFVPDPVYSGIQAAADDSVILSSELDVTRVVVKAVDQAGNVLPYLSESFDIETQGDIEVIGPTRLSACGGITAFWVRSRLDAKPGPAEVSITSYRGFSKTVSIMLE